MMGSEGPYEESRNDQDSKNSKTDEDSGKGKAPRRRALDTSGHHKLILQIYFFHLNLDELWFTYEVLWPWTRYWWSMTTKAL
jgi:hypothetical protein